MIVKLDTNERDTIVDINSNSNAISYNLTQYNLGINSYELTILEIDHTNDIIIGEKKDTLTFKVLP